MNHHPTLRSLCSFVYLVLVSTLIKYEATKTDIKDSNTTQSHINHDVFISFRGSDIRQGFLSHLVDALHEEKVIVFVDNQIHKGDEIAQSLFHAIETSFISLVIFSENYGSSRWCLDELVKIVECREKNGQILVPVFYRLDPTIVRHQNGTYANAFAEHEKKFNLTKVQEWKSVVKESASISGYPSSKFANDSVLVKEIVQYVVNRLDDIHKYKPHSKRVLIGLGNHISHVKSLLMADKDVRAIGIWGMAGIGKTTIAEEVFDRLCSEYKSCYFMADVREEWRRHGRMHLKKKLYSALLRKEDLNIERPHGLPYVVERRLQGMKVLVVLDDVSDKEQLEILIGTLEWFGKGSRIIITTRDKQVLAKRVDDNDLYQLKPLDFDDSFQLFILTAFGQNHPTMEYDNDKLLEKMVNYAQGNPLVLKELGYFIGGKDRKTWKSECEKLTREPLQNVHDAIRLTCNIYLNGVDEIVECRKKERQILEPLSYNFFIGMDLSTNALAVQHDKNFNWTTTLQELRFRNESVPVFMDKPHSERLLIRHGNQISHVESLLMSDSKDVRAIGIWGMAVKGKRVIAEEVYRRLCSEYDSCYFKANVREEWERNGRMHLKKELYSTLLGKQDLNIERPHGLPYFVERRLRHMKVLVVLDNVRDEEQLETLIETLDWFGRGSRIIITSRDKQVFLNRVDDNDQGFKLLSAVSTAILPTW